MTEDMPGKIGGPFNLDHINLPMTYEPKMPVWGLRPPQRIIIPPNRPDLVEEWKNIIGWTDVDHTSLDRLHQAGEMVIGFDLSDDEGYSTVMERRPDGSLRVIDFIVPWNDRRRQKRLDRGIKFKARPSRGFARHIRKQKARPK